VPGNSIGSDCPTGKGQFADKRSADVHVRRWQRMGRNTMRSYKCRLCKCWHIGNQLPRPPKRKKRIK